MIDFLGQCFAVWISERHGKAEDRTYEKKLAIKLQLRYLFRGFQNLVERQEYKAKTESMLLKDLKRELRRKLSDHYLSRYYQIWKAMPFSIKKHGDQLVLDVFGHQFIGESVKSGFGVLYPEVDVEAFFLEAGDEHNVKDGLIEFLTIEEDPMLMNPETGRYESAPMNELHDHVHNLYPGFSRTAKPSTLLDGVFITPIHNFPRVSMQQGSFQLFGLSRFWNVRRTMIFLFDEKTRVGTEPGSGWWKTVISALAENDMDILGPTGRDKELTSQDLIWSYTKFVHGCEIYVLNPCCCEKYRNVLRKELKALGVDQGVLGQDPLNILEAMKSHGKTE